MDIAVQRFAVHKSITVEAPVAHVFRTFTAGHNDWWPRSHHIGKGEAFTAILEPRAGGRCFERAPDGTECDWGRVLVWEEPHRIVMTWDLDTDFRFDATLGTEVEVRFIAEAPGRTRVELTHRCLERYGDKAEFMRNLFDSPNAWTGGLEAMRDRAEQTAR